MTNLSYIFASFFGNHIPANVMLKTLKEFGLGVRRQNFLNEIRKVRNIEIDEEKTKALFTRTKYLTEEQKENFDLQLTYVPKKSVLSIFREALRNDESWMEAI